MNKWLYALIPFSLGFAIFASAQFSNNSGGPFSNNIIGPLQIRTSGATTSVSLINNSWLFGIGTTSPYAKLSVTGPVVAEYFVATSTTATSTYANGIQLSSGCFRLPNGTCAGTGSGGYATIQEEGVDLTARTKLNFIGSIVTCADNVSVTDCTFSAGTAASSTLLGDNNLFTGSNRLASTTIGTTTVGTLNATSSITSRGDLTVYGIASLLGILNVNGAGTSTINNGLAVLGTGTSTYIANGLQAGTLNVTSQTASSTFANGIQLSSGCFRLSTGSCANISGTGTFNAGTANRLTYYSGANTLDSANYLTTDITNTRLGISTSTPTNELSVQGNAMISGTTTVGSLVATSTLFVGGTTGSSMVVLGNGNVGIGTTSPSGRLSVKGAGTGTGFLSYMEDSAGTNRFVIQDNGNVGIGTTSPQDIFTIQGAADIKSTIFASGNNNAGLRIWNGNRHWIWQVYADGTDRMRLVDETAGAERLAVTNDGNVGIGTTNPTALLEIYRPTNGIGMQINVGGVSNMVQLGSEGAAGNGIMVLRGTTFIAGGAAGTAGLAIGSGVAYTDVPNVSTNINLKGNVGIGTTTPGSILSVQGVGNFVSAGTSTLYTHLTVPSFNATSTTATSTIAGFLNVTGTNSTSTISAGFRVSGAGTSTVIDNGLQAGTLNVTSQTSSSTIAGGLNIGGGISFGTYNCSGSGSGGKFTTDAQGRLICAADAGSGGAVTVNTGIANRVSYYDTSTSLSAVNSVVIDQTNARFGIGTTTPSKALSVTGDIYFDSATTTYGSTTASQLRFVYARAATTTIPDLTAGAYAISTTSAQGAIPMMSFDTRTNRAFLLTISSSTNDSFIGGFSGQGRFSVGSTSPATTTSLVGSLLVSGNATVANLTASGTVTFAGVPTSGALQTGDACFDAVGRLINDSVLCVASNERVKDSIKPLDIGLKELLKSDPKRFYWKPSFNGSYQLNPNYSGEQIGFSANVLQRIDPRLVTLETEDSSSPDGTIVNKKGDVHGVRYDTAITAWLAQSIIDLNAKVEQGIPSARRALEENWQWGAIGLLFFMVLYQQIQIKKLKK